MEQVERSLPFFCALPEMDWLDPRLIARCQSEADAFMLCWAKRRVRYSLRHAAALLEIPASHLSKTSCPARNTRPGASEGAFSGFVATGPSGSGRTPPRALQRLWSRQNSGASASWRTKWEG